MCRPHNKLCLPQTTCPPKRAGMTLAETLIAGAIMGLIALAMGTLALTVEQSERAITGQGTAVQHARVVLDRIERRLNEATASEQFPGFAVFNTTVSSTTFPETLVVWAPTGTAVDANGLPRFSEIVVFCPNPTQPTEFLEITAPSDTRTVPALTSTSTWQSELNALKTGNTSTKTVITNLLRTGAVSSTSTGVTTSTILGAVRFEAEKHPTATEWSSYKGGSLAWDDINWPLDRYGATTGQAVNWCRIELQLISSPTARETDPNGLTAIPFFGSSVVNYKLNK